MFLGPSTTFWVMKGGVTTFYTVPVVAFVATPFIALGAVAVATVAVENVIENRQRTKREARIDAEYSSVADAYAAMRSGKRAMK